MNKPPHRSAALRRPDLYCITDARLSSLTFEEQTAAFARGGARLIQLRAKQQSDAEFSLVATRCLAICRDAGATLVINDRVHIAAEIGAPALHLGQDDISPTAARRIVGEATRIGVSTHTREQFLAALAEPVDYIALGPVFGTSTKENPDLPPGMDLVAEAAQRLENDARPLVLIGGITRENLPQLQRVAPQAIIAVISDILRAPDIAARVIEYRRLLA